MKKKILGNRLRVCRRRAGLSQPNLASIVGHAYAWQIGRHEKLQNIPPLLTALAYEAVFKTPVSTLFDGLYKTVEHGIEKRLGEFEASLKAQAEAGSKKAVAPQLAWIARRRAIEPTSQG